MAGAIIPAHYMGLAWFDSSGAPPMFLHFELMDEMKTLFTRLVGPKP